MSDSFPTQALHIDRQQTYPDSVFPHVIAYDRDAAPAMASDEAIDPRVRPWVFEHCEELLSLATRHGAVAFRDFPTKTVDAFDDFIQGLGLENFPYDRSLSNAVRINRTPRVFSANEAPPDVRIFFHHEMAQTPLYPRYILFFCEIAAAEGGATPLCRSDILFKRLTERCPKFASDCESKGLQYTNVMPDSDDPNSGMGRSWQKTLGVDSRDAAQARLDELNYSYQWLDNGCLRATTPPLPAVMEVSPGVKTFFNQLIAAYCGWKDERNDPSDAIRHGDGSRLDRDGVAVAIELSEELAYDHQWQVGDIVLLDNTVAMHARRPFVGTRKVLASLAEMRTHAFELASS
ncbi:TauD/TfdA family dioxygenase [Neorhodopirellula pilleata]|uniref:Taurine catabolism dioxygenase TauD, TfdA family n=1 Tax=Neorhodopirellula pilleata TaxID=2714738 RepID=A0A5C6A3N2_9BACT|nr:TauD/TfdA family dioxygenase [Neorhodopirellula pilleata]TWT93023.1 Taurine catabolism dioxygenase TauD, TfdA family [Neorhodopirellula pilleata]